MYSGICHSSEICSWSELPALGLSVKTATLFRIDLKHRWIILFRDIVKQKMISGMSGLVFCVNFKSSFYYYFYGENNFPLKWARIINWLGSEGLVPFNSHPHCEDYNVMQILHQKFTVQLCLSSSIWESKFALPPENSLIQQFSFSHCYCTCNLYYHPYSSNMFWSQWGCYCLNNGDMAFSD